MASDALSKGFTIANMSQAHEKDNKTALTIVSLHIYGTEQIAIICFFKGNKTAAVGTLSRQLSPIGGPPAIELRMR